MKVAEQFSESVQVAGHENDQVIDSARG
jgi:hypothetical protein